MEENKEEVTGSNETNSFYAVNGVENQLSNLPQDDGVNLPSMESMLEAATDLQNDHVEQKASQISGRLELNHPVVDSHPHTHSAGRPKLRVYQLKRLSCFK